MLCQKKDLAQCHPCFSREAHHHYGRIHLPVAPACNIQCRYCVRKFDCANESRPGVSSRVLSVKEALEMFQLCSKLEGIIPALEPAHALARVRDLASELGKDGLILMNMCGRGDKDVFSVAKALGVELGE